MTPGTAAVMTPASVVLSTGLRPYIEQAFTREHVSIRMLLPDTTRPMAVPCRVEDLADDPDYRARMHQITGRHSYSIHCSVGSSP